ncbi:MAG: DUF2147 domain-containing protein [Bacteroidales bacterium]|nr:DUF2147 domain-containing protein [Bacteroidales bacterium]
MKRSFTLILITVLCIGGYAQKADDILGIYFCVDPFSKKQSQAEIYKAKDGTYEAKVVWTNDIKGQDQVGLVFMKGLTYNAKENEYQNGKIQYPGKKGTYKSYIRIVDGGQTLKMRGYLGVSLFGMTVDWKREEKVRPAPTK